MNKNSIAAFDFDGTITVDDTLIELFKFTHGVRFYLWFLLLSPILVLYKLGFIGNDTTKQVVFSCFYRGWTIERFDDVCTHFADTIKVRPLAIDALREHLDRADRVVIVSASPENWVRIWAHNNNIEVVLATKLEVVNGRLTGKFSSPNCYGDQKVVRLKAVFDDLSSDRQSVTLIAYGDSSGDRSMIEFADLGYYKKF